MAEHKSEAQALGREKGALVPKRRSAAASSGGSCGIRAARSILRGGVKEDLGDDVAGKAEVGLAVHAVVDELPVLLVFNLAVTSECACYTSAPNLQENSDIFHPSTQQVNTRRACQ